jgi:hypothetical protein
MRQWYARWHTRHRNVVSFHLHLLGLPICFLGAAALLPAGRWVQAIALALAGFFLQRLGHLIEGSPSGEQLLWRRLVAWRSGR